jgi:hypothetical protein
MSGTTDPVREPVDNAEWARAADQRISALENPASQRIGPWVLSASADGNLIASYVDGGSVVLAKKPVGGESDPDQIEDFVVPSISAVLLGTCPLSAPGGVVTFDGVGAQAGGNWTGDQATFNAILVPAPGIYTMHATVHFDDNPGYNTGCAIRVNGTSICASLILGYSSIAWGTVTCGRVYRLNAGDTVDLWAYMSNSNFEVGRNQLWGPSAATSLDLAMVTRLE